MAETMQRSTQMASQRAEAWASCLVLNTRKFSPMGGSAQDTVDAAFGACAQFEAPLRTAVLGMHLGAAAGTPGGISGAVGAAEVGADRTMDSLRTGYRGKMLALVLEERAASSGAPAVR